MPAEFTLGELSVRFGLTLRGEPSLKVHGVATLARAESGALSFLANSRYRRQLETTLENLQTSCLDIYFLHNANSAQMTSTSTAPSSKCAHSRNKG